MPFATQNILLRGLSGKLGNIVVRQLNGKTVIQAAPVRKAPPTPGELANRETFKQAVAYAKQARQNPELWEIYLAEAKRRGGTSNAYAVAISDFRHNFRLVKVRLGGKLKERKPDLKRNLLPSGLPSAHRKADQVLLLTGSHILWPVAHRTPACRLLSCFSTYQCFGLCATDRGEKRI